MPAANVNTPASAKVAFAPGRNTVRYPGADTRSFTEPAARPPNRYPPSAPDVTDPNERPDTASNAVTDAPGTTPPTPFDTTPNRTGLAVLG